MAHRQLTDADIEALIQGSSVEGTPAQLTELVTSLRQHADQSPSVPVSDALSEFTVTGMSSAAAASSTAAAGAEVVSIKRSRASRLANAASVVGLAPIPLLVGATLVAAAAVGGAHVSGIVDVALSLQPAASQSSSSSASATARRT